EIASLTAGEDSDAGSKMGFEVEIGRLLKERVKRRGAKEAIELEMADTVLAGRYFMGGGDDIEAALIEDDRVRLDFSLLRIFARGFVFGGANPPLENRPVDRAQDAVLPLVAFGRHAANEQDLAIGLIVLPDRRRQFFLQLAPERLDCMPKGSAG